MMGFAFYLLPALATLQTSGDVELETTAAVHYVPDTLPTCFLFYEQTHI